MAAQYPNQGSQGPPERNLSNPLFHQHYAQHARTHFTQSYVAAPSSAPIFATALPPNFITMPQLPQQQVPQQGLLPIFPQQSHLPGQPIPQQNIFPMAMQSQLQQLHHHPYPLSQQQQVHFSPHHQKSNFSYGSGQPNLGQPELFERHQVQPGLPQSSTLCPASSNNQYHGVSNLDPHVRAFAQRLYQQMNEQAPAEFIHGTTQPTSTSNPRISHPRPQYHFLQSQKPNGIPPPQSYVTLTGFRRERTPPSTNTRDFPNNPGNIASRGISAQKQAGGTMSKSTVAENPEPTTKMEYSLERNGSSMQHDTSTPSGHAQQLSTVTPLSDAMITEASADSGYMSREYSGSGTRLLARDETNETLTSSDARLEHELDLAALPPEFLEPPNVPFMKVTRSTTPVVADKLPSLAEDSPLKGEDQADRPEVISHPLHRRVTWQQYIQAPYGAKPFGFYCLEHSMISDPLGWLRDFSVELLVQIPNGGAEDFYLGEPVNSASWVKQVAKLSNNVDLWLPVPLIWLFRNFDDTPYGIANEFPESLQEAVHQTRKREFTLPEATTLMKISKKRLYAAFSQQPQISWDLHTGEFNQEHGWAPTVERMRVLDLMFQVDLVYYWQGLGGPLHFFSICNQNELRKSGGMSVLAGFD